MECDPVEDHDAVNYNTKVLGTSFRDNEELLENRVATFKEYLKRFVLEKEAETGEEIKDSEILVMTHFMQLQVFLKNADFKKVNQTNFLKPASLVFTEFDLD